MLMYLYAGMVKSNSRINDFALFFPCCSSEFVHIKGFETQRDEITK